MSNTSLREENKYEIRESVEKGVFRALSNKQEVFTNDWGDTSTEADEANDKLY